MARRHLCLLSLVLGIYAFVCPSATRGGENTPEPWDKSGAGQYLDRRGEDWFKFGGAYRGQGAYDHVMCQLPQPAPLRAGPARPSPALQ